MTVNQRFFQQTGNERRPNPDKRGEHRANCDLSSWCLEKMNETRDAGLNLKFENCAQGNEDDNQAHRRGANRGKNCHRQHPCRAVIVWWCRAPFLGSELPRPYSPASSRMPTKTGAAGGSRNRGQTPRPISVGGVQKPKRVVY